SVPKEGKTFDPSASIVPLPDAGQTMLDMGPRTPKAGPAAPAKPFDPSASIVPLPDAGQTMLDLGTSRLGGSVDKGKTIDPNTSETDIGTIMLGNTPLPLKPPVKTDKTLSQTVAATGKIKGPGAESTASVSKNATVQQTGTVGTATATVRVADTNKGKTVGGSPVPGQKWLPPEVYEISKNPDRTFGKYVLMSELGRGGAGVVYKAWDTLLQQYVALKFIRNQDDGDTDSTSGSSQIEEFQKEARMSVRLRHPNIVRIYELGS